MLNTTKILETYGEIGVDVLKKSIRSISVSNKTADSISYKVTSTNTSDKLTFSAREFFDLLEKGRGPTSKKPSPDMIKNLAEYAQARGINTIGGKSVTPEQAAWALATSLNKKGDKTFQMGGRVVYSEDLNKFVEELKEQLKKDFISSFQLSIKSALRGTKSS